LIAVSWAFDGWSNITYAAGEIKNPQRNIPLTLFLSTVLLTSLYLLVNYVYLLALPIDEMQGVETIAEKASTRLWGDRISGLVSAAILISILGALHGAIFVGPRVYFAMARDGVFFQSVGRVHPRFRTPAFALIVQAVWACLVALTGTFEQLFTFVIFITLFFWLSAAAAVFTLRYTRPDMPRPYKTWGYPAVPLLFIVLTIILIVNTLIKRPVESLVGIGITVIGIPVYYYWKRRYRKIDAD
jgi:APA family basic amino acid/polyamine antiporter